MMNTAAYTLLCLVLIGSAIFSANAGDASISKTYQNDKSIECGGKTYDIPSYFPYTDETHSPSGSLFITSECSHDNIYVYIALEKGCTSSHSCSFASFISEKIGAASSEFIDSLSNIKVNISGKYTGFLIPAQCGAYCSNTKLAWIDYESQRLYFVTTKNPQETKENIAELKKSAESYTPILEGK